MQDTLTSLAVILMLAMIVFAIFGRSASAVAMSPAAFSRRGNLRFAIAIPVFLANNYRIYVLAAHDAVCAAGIATNSIPPAFAPGATPLCKSY